MSFPLSCMSVNLREEKTSDAIPAKAGIQYFKAF